MYCGNIPSYMWTTLHLLYVIQNPSLSLLKKHEYKLKLKGTCNIFFHLGCDFFRDSDGNLCMAPKKYIENMIDGYNIF